MQLPYHYIETEPYEEGFAEYYQKHIVPLAHKYEPKRADRKYTQVLNIALAVSAGALSVKAILKSAWFIKSQARKKGNFLLLPPIFFWWLLVRRPKVAYFNAVKAEVLPKVLAFFGEFSYLPKGEVRAKFNQHCGEEASFVPLWLPSEDIIGFSQDGITVTVFEQTQWDVFSDVGVLYLCVRVPQPFRGEMLVLSKPRNDAERAIMRKTLKARSHLAKMAAREDETFDFYSNNTKWVSHWLDGGFLNELRELNTVFDKPGLMYSVRGREILMRLNLKRNLFEVGRSYNNPIVNANDMKGLLKELDFMLKTVDWLKRQAERKRNITYDLPPPPPARKKSEPIQQQEQQEDIDWLKIRK